MYVYTYVRTKILLQKDVCHWREYEYKLVNKYLSWRISWIILIIASCCPMKYIKCMHYILKLKEKEGRNL